MSARSELGPVGEVRVTHQRSNSPAVSPAIALEAKDTTTEARNDRPIGGRLLIVESQVLVAMGLLLALSERRWDVQTSSGPTSLDVVEHAQRFKPDCVLLNSHLGHGDGLGNGLDLIRPLTATGAVVIMLTAERRRAALAEYLEQGAVGWLGKDAELDEVDSTVSRVLSGQMIIGRTERAELLERLRLEREQSSREHAIFERLTEREACVLGALTDGLSAEQIAEENYVSVATVRSQIRAVLQKLGVRSQLAAVAIASPHRGLLPQRGSVDRDRRRVQPTDRRASTANYALSPS